MRLASLRPPRLRTIDEEERSATWLELFYDLVFVAAVAVLGGRILTDPSWEGLMSYAAFFGLLWWLWRSQRRPLNIWRRKAREWQLLIWMKMPRLGLQEKLRKAGVKQ